MIKKTVLIALIFSFENYYAQTISTVEIKKHISYLASDKLKGRGTASAEETLAAEYIAKEFAAYKLQPKGNNGYFFDYIFKTPATPHDTIGKGEEKKSKDVVAFLDNKAASTIVIGAHYDHLGLGK